MLTEDEIAILRSEKKQRMLAVYERDKKLRESADLVFLHGDQVAPRNGATVYVETATGAKLRRYFEREIPPNE